MTDRQAEIAADHTEFTIKMIMMFSEELADPETHTAVALAARTFFEYILLEANIGHVEPQHIKARFKLETVSFDAARTIKKVADELGL